MNKYHAKKTTVDGITFDSKKEAKRYGDLLLMQLGGVISKLARQVSYDLKVNDVLICRYVADFEYVVNGQCVTEDCKGVRTPVYKLKARLMKAIHGIEIREV